MFDHGEYVGERAEGVEETACVGLWGVECGGGGLFVHRHLWKSDVEARVQAGFVYGMSGRIKSWVADLHL